MGVRWVGMERTPALLEWKSRGNKVEKVIMG